MNFLIVVSLANLQLLTEHPFCEVSVTNTETKYVIISVYFSNHFFNIHFSHKLKDVIWKVQDFPKPDRNSATTTNLF